MFVTIINDCKDANAFGRQATRAAALFQTAVHTVGVGGYAELEAAGNLVDVLDASMGLPGVILVNVAPRHGSGKQWPNGTPFGYFWYQQTLVVSSIAGMTLSLVKKMRTLEECRVLDIPTVMQYAVQNKLLSESHSDHIIHTQFRSFHFLPFAAKWVFDTYQLPSTRYDVKHIQDVESSVWWIDNFGNCKTTLLPEDVGFSIGSIIETKIGNFQCFSRLKDVPNEQAGIIVGSSGLEEKRFLEIVVQGENAAERFGLYTGSKI